MPLVLVHEAGYRIELMTVNPLAHLPVAQTAALRRRDYTSHERKPWHTPVFWAENKVI
jgi:hypothetical protein